LVLGGLIALPFQRTVYSKYARLIQSLRLSWIDIIFISLCAGFGEELLFRAAIQPLLGIWITAVLFVALHGYLNPKSWRLTVYGLYLVGAIASLGYLCSNLGVLSAAMAHAVIDIILLSVLAYTNKQPLSLR
jgi:membrane protease YdiL (CAAX protease family)